MKTKVKIGLEFEVDKLTNSIENLISEASYSTEVLVSDLKELEVLQYWRK
jgi:hypothetical protein